MRARTAVISLVAASAWQRDRRRTVLAAAVSATAGMLFAPAVASADAEERFRLTFSGNLNYSIPSQPGESYTFEGSITGSADLYWSPQGSTVYGTTRVENPLITVSYRRASKYPCPGLPGFYTEELQTQPGGFVMSGAKVLGLRWSGPYALFSAFFPSDPSDRWDLVQVPVTRTTNGCGSPLTSVSFDTNLGPGNYFALNLDAPRQTTAATDPERKLFAASWRQDRLHEPGPLDYEVRVQRIGEPMAGTLSGTVFVDRDRNQQRGDGTGGAPKEEGVADWPIWDDANNNHVHDPYEPAALTDAAGHYSLEVPASHWVVIRGTPELTGWKCTQNPSFCGQTIFDPGWTSPEVIPPGQDVHRDFGVFTEEPIIFVPGFMASEIVCSASNPEKLWMGYSFGLPRGQLADMMLGPTGATVPSENGCEAVPNGDPLREIILPLINNKNIHGVSEGWLKRLLMDPGRVKAFGWDWRKPPSASVERLDDLVDELLAQSHAQKVVIVAHSYGGLLTREYIRDPDRAAKVDRAALVGVPSWGSPKPIFPLKLGTEAATSGDLDNVLPAKDTVRQFARNLAGMFHLYPDYARYGAWLGADAKARLTASEVEHYVGSLGGSTSMYRAGQQFHEAIAGWQSNGVELLVVVGTGLNTIGRVHWLDDRRQPLVRVDWTNGDETVPMRSADQDAGTIIDPFDTPIRYMCGVVHMAMLETVAVQTRLALFLTRGVTPPQPVFPGPCHNSGVQVNIFYPDDRAARSASVNDDPLEPGEQLTALDASGAVSMLATGDQILIATNDSQSVAFTVPVSGVTVTAARIDGDRTGPEVKVGDFTQPVSINATAGQLQIHDKTITLPPVTGTPTPTATATTPTATPTASPAATAAPPTPRATPPSATPTATVQPSSRPDRAAPRTAATVRKRGRMLVVTLTATDRSGIKMIAYRVGRGAWRAYTKPLKLTRANARKLSFYATDRAGNRERARKLGKLARAR